MIMIKTNIFYRFENVLYSNYLYSLSLSLSFFLSFAHTFETSNELFFYNLFITGEICEHMKTESNIVKLSKGY